MTRLVGVQGLAAGTMFALTTDTVIIGRDGECDIVLMDNTVSQQHARITREDGGRIVVYDLGSANGVFVNNQRVQQASLSAGDTLQIGDSVFDFEP